MVHDVYRYSKSSWSDAFLSHQTLSLTVSVTAPTLLIPVSPTNPHSDLLVINLGQVVGAHTNFIVRIWYLNQSPHWYVCIEYGITITSK
jgi:hypothetical protein